MNAWRVAEEFRLILEADEAFAGIACVNDQDDVAVSFPRIVVGATVRPFIGSAQLGRAVVEFTVESHAQDATPEAGAGLLHEARVEKVWAKIFGLDDTAQAATRAAIAAEINAAGRLEVEPRYVPQPTSLGRVGHRFSTPLALVCGVCFPVPV